MNNNHISKTYFFDRIENGIVIPNGLISSKLINIYLNEKIRYKKNYHLHKAL